MRDIVGLRLQAGECAYSSADAMLYALSLGFGDEPLDTRQLRYVYEAQLSTLPSLPLVLGWPGIWMPLTGHAFDHPHMLHAEERLALHRPLPPAGIVRDETYVDAIVDRGVDRGAFVHTRKELFSENDGLHLATVRSCVLARRDGGCGSGGQPPETLAATPDRAPDVIATRRTLPQQALLYRLNGDSNPVHGAPQLAAVAGFDRPLLHGRCTLGMALREVLAGCLDYQADGIVGISARFAAPFFPGETLRVQIWRDAHGLTFSADVVERELTVLSHDLIELRG